VVGLHWGVCTVPTDIAPARVPQDIVDLGLRKADGVVHIEPNLSRLEGEVGEVRGVPQAPPLGAGGTGVWVLANKYLSSQMRPLGVVLQLQM